VAIAPGSIIELANWKAFILQYNEEIRRRDDPGLALADWILSLESDAPVIRAIQSRFRAMAAVVGEDEQVARHGCPQWEALDPDGLESFVRQLMNEVSPLMGDYSPLAEYLALAFEYGIDFVNGTRLPTNIGQTGFILELVYEIGFRFVNWSPFLTLLSHSSPGLRILEIGGGTGSATRTALQGLKSEGGSHLYSRYVFTDASRDCISAAQEKFRSEANMEFQLLDISSDPEEQGFQPHNFDLIIVSYVRHSLDFLIFLPDPSLGPAQRPFATNGPREYPKTIMLFGPTTAS
jgi:hypothetical protein